MSPSDELLPVLKKLRLSGVLETLELRTREAAEDNLPLEEFLLRLLGDEVERRESKQLALRLKRAQFEHARTLEEFDFSFNPEIPKGRIIDLAAGHYLARHENVLLLGPAGVGKSHVAQALGHRACLMGHTCLYVEADKLFRDLRAARADDSYERRMARYTGPDLLLVDDLGLKPMRHNAAEDLYEIIRRRYQHGSMVVTSNRAVEEWYPLFGDPLLASAAMDRLLHNAHVIEMRGDSYRNPPPRRRKQRRAGARAAA